MSGYPPRELHLESFYRQYVGVLQKGKYFVYVNAFPPRTELAESSWRTHAIVVCDGGPSFFGALYEPSAKQFVALDFNDTVGGPVRF
jgi:hypothetical protein